MSNYFFVEPEVAGGLGEHSVLDRSTYPPKVGRLHYLLDGWLGDHLLESFPCYVLTKELADRLSESRLSGYELEPVEITTSRQFEELYPNRKLPLFYWLKVTGEAGKDDFGIAVNDWRLVVSEKTLAVIKPLCPASCDVSEYDTLPLG